VNRPDMLVLCGAVERSRSPRRSRMSPLTVTPAGDSGLDAGDEKLSVPSRSRIL